MGTTAPLYPEDALSAAGTWEALGWVLLVGPCRRHLPMAHTALQPPSHADPIPHRAPGPVPSPAPLRALEEAEQFPGQEGWRGKRFPLLGNIWIQLLRAKPSGAGPLLRASPCCGRTAASPPSPSHPRARGCPCHPRESLHPPVPFVSLRKIDLEARWKSPAANRVRRCLTAAPRCST